MALNITNVKQPTWALFNHEGCVNVEFKSFLHRDGRVALAMLRFGKNATVHEHPANFDVDVICLKGKGFTSVGKEQAPIQAGQRVHWPSGKPHRLWTTDAEMVTLMVEYLI